MIELTAASNLMDGETEAQNVTSVYNFCKGAQQSLDSKSSETKKPLPLAETRKHLEVRKPQRCLLFAESSQRAICTNDHSVSSSPAFGGLSDFRLSPFSILISLGDRSTETNHCSRLQRCIIPGGGGSFCVFARP